jgi:hypothetical protein
MKEYHKYKKNVGIRFLKTWTHLASLVPIVLARDLFGMVLS